MFSLSIPSALLGLLRCNKFHFSAFYPTQQYRHPDLQLLFINTVKQGQNINLWEF